MYMNGDLVMVQLRSFLVFCITVLLFVAECTVSGHEFNVTDLLVFYVHEYDDYACQQVTVVNYDTIHDAHGGKLKCSMDFKMSVPPPLIEATVVSSEDVLDGAIGRPQCALAHVKEHILIKALNGKLSKNNKISGPQSCLGGVKPAGLSASYQI